MTEPVKLYAVWDSRDGTENAEGAHAYFRDLETATKFAQGLADYHGQTIAIEEEEVRTDLPMPQLCELLLFGVGWAKLQENPQIRVEPRATALRRPARQLDGDEVSLVYYTRAEVDGA